MRKQMANRALALLLALCLLAALPGTRIARAEGKAVTISSVEDLLALRKQCTLDTWSQGRTVVLAADLDLAGCDFAPIPTFGGTFDGQGHTISNLHLAGEGPAVGFFRYLQTGAVVRDLHLTGTAAPAGNACQVGAVAGVNSGSIQGCSFQGTVQGESSVGGIVGLNREGGEVSGCAVSGAVLGSSATGGVAGQNLGVLLKCTNAASVNTASPDAQIRLQDLTAEAPLEQLAASEDSESGEGLLSSHSDTGGIVGLSHGVVQSCANTGAVGYPHVGYNVGGVAGRQSGYMAGCTNSGAVCGRKDVGGITGQAEPDVIWNPGTETLDRLDRELDVLDSLINQSLDGADAHSSRISQRLTALGSYTDDARDRSRSLLEQTTGFVDGNVEEINSLSAAVTAALDRAAPGLDDLADAAGRIDDLCGRLNEALDALADAGAIGQDVAAAAARAAQRLEQAGGAMEGAVDGLRSALRRLQDAVVHRDPAAERQALAELAAAVSDLGTALSQAGEASAQLLGILRDALQGMLDTLPAPWETPSGFSQALRDALAALTSTEALRAMEELEAAMAAMGAAAGQAGESLAVLTQNTEFHWEALRDSLAGTGNAMAELRAAARSFSAAMEALGRAAEGAGEISGPMGDALDALRGASNITAGIGGRLENAFEAMGGAVDELRRGGPVTLRPLGDSFREDGDGLYDAVTSLSKEMEGLHAEVDGAQGSLSEDLRGITRQFSVITDLLLDAAEQVREGVQEPEVISDSSDQSIAEAREGKITLCTNTGPVDGDRNVGGVAGTMAIDYDLDPEDDIPRFSLGSTYETKAVLLENVNRGTVTAKKDCAGGLVGRMDLGALASCENYGGVSSASGSYVGGIAGWSDAAIRESFAKCSLSGGNDVGGIAGWAARLHGCRAIVTITGASGRTGAVAGSADLAGGRITGNRFVDTGTAGIDGVSYAGVAEPIEYAALCGEANIPEEFTSFTLTLLADGTAAASIPFQYGQDLSRIPLPVPPEKAGYYGRWPSFDTSGLCSDVTVEAVYTPWAALVASQETTEAGLSLALAEGQFTEDAVLHVYQGTRTPPPAAEGSPVWEISLTGTDLDASAQVPLRLLAGKGGAVWQYTDSGWRKVTAEANGQYLLLSMDGLSGVYCTALAQEHSALVLLLPVGLAAAAAAVLVWQKKRRRHPKAA